jgi:hypothetical protein
MKAAPFLFFAPRSGGREPCLGQKPVHAVILDVVDHVEAPPHRMGELAEPDRRGIAVARNAEIDEVAVGEIGAREHRGYRRTPS